MTSDVWAVGNTYDAYMGRWSRAVAAGFQQWLDVPAGRRWLDSGCGTGALTGTIAQPASVVGADLSVGFLTTARQRVSDPRFTFVAADARALPFAADRFDVAVSALSVNFVPDPPAATAELARVTRPGGVVAAYVWDYAGGGMQLISRFWESAVAIDPTAVAQDEASRFALCQPEPLRRLWMDAGLSTVEVRPIEVPMAFTDFDDFWSPFLGGQGPAPAYVMSLTEERRAVLRERLRADLATEPDGSIRLTARAWAVRGTAEPIY